MPADTTLWTIAATLGAAFFTSVLAQYLFAPWLEARKEVHMEQYREQRAFAERLSAMAAASLAADGELMENAISVMRDPGAYAGARTRDLRAFILCVTMAGTHGGIFGADPELLLHDTLQIAAQLADPMTVPWRRPWLRLRLTRRLKRHGRDPRTFN